MTKEEIKLKKDIYETVYSTENYVSTINKPLSKELAQEFRDLIKGHWAVENFHKYKDINLKEDSYHKSISQACAQNYFNNLAFTVHQYISTQKFKKLKFDLLAMFNFFYPYLKPSAKVLI